MIRVMVVDDEPLAREELIRLIRKDPAFEVANEAANGREAIEKLKKDPVEVVFLDIEMPEVDGLEAAGRLAGWEKPPLVVFATAYHEYAIQAFEANAIDYVLKPYDPERLKKTFARVKEFLANKAASPKEKLVSLERYLVQKGALGRIVGRRRNSKEKIVIHPDQIYYFHVHLTEVLAKLETEELIIYSTLKELLACLDPARFVQTHKAYIVNLDKVEKVAPLFSGNFEIKLKDPKQSSIPLSRRCAQALKSRLASW